MKPGHLSSAAAIVFVAMVGSASATSFCPTCTIVQSSSPLLDLGTGTANSRQNIASPIIPAAGTGITSITFAGGASPNGSASGVFAGSVLNNFTSTFGNSTTNYLAAQPGGSVTVTYATPQTHFELL